MELQAVIKVVFPARCRLSTELAARFLQGPLDVVSDTAATKPTQCQPINGVKNVYSIPISMELQAVMEVGPLNAAFNALAPRPTRCQPSNGAKNVYSTPISMGIPAVIEEYSMLWDLGLIDTSFPTVSLYSPLDAAFNALAPRPTRRQPYICARNVYSTPISMELQAVIEVAFLSEVSTKYKL
ncbi:hypothetical protein HOY80DRAFT_1029791 [Tuber brumale]|nr:hypothetical protein HOY80DRAFT_1029791 [Tuber brumale]